MAFYDVCALLIVLIGGCIYILATRPLEFDDNSRISWEILARSPFLPSWALALTRLASGGLVWCSCWYLVHDPAGLRMEVLMRDGSNKKVLLLHAERFTTFTVWCWALQGAFYALAVVASLLDAGILSCLDHPFLSTLLSSPAGLAAQRVALGAAWVLFETSFSVAFLVSAVVTFVLIPATVKRKLPLDSFFLLLPLVMHNLNAVNMAVELSLNSLPFSPSHYVFTVMFGMAYVVFSWYWFSKKGIFYYFFLDYERQGAVFWHLGLVSLLGACFLGGALLSHHIKAGSAVGFGVLFSTTFAVMKWPPSLADIRLKQKAA